MQKSTLYVLLATVAVVITVPVAAFLYSAHQNRLADEREQARIQAGKAKLAARLAAEEKRRAALTPAQRAAEEKTKQQKIAEATKEVAEKEKEKARQEAEKKKVEVQQQAALGGAILLKRAMHDPEAFQLQSLHAMPSGAACYEYRAKNGFGAIRSGSAILTKSGRMLTHEQHGNTFVAAWNKECARISGKDITSLAKIYLSASR